MKTIRTNTFETNSSSTHSITIKTRDEHNAISQKSLFENNTLYPVRLQQYHLNEYYDHRCLALDTVIKKSSWFCSVLYNFCEHHRDEKYNSLENSKKITESYITQILTELQKYLGSTNRIELTNNEVEIGAYHCFTYDYESPILDKLNDLFINFNLTKFNKEIINGYILNDNIVINDDYIED